MDLHEILYIAVPQRMKSNGLSDLMTCLLPPLSQIAIKCAYMTHKLGCGYATSHYAKTFSLMP